jgi:acyl-CoA synthetase (NDP forming)
VYTLARSAAEVEAAVKALGGAVAVKVQSGDIPHKTEAGAVSLNVSPENARAAYERVLENAKHFAPAAKIEGVVVQPMAPPGREVIVGISRDKCWGSLLMLGLGGVLVEALNDAVLAPVPLDREAALALISRLKCNVMFGPYRGMQPADIEALADLIVKLSQFASDHADDIAEVDLNPVIVHGKGDGVSVADALILKRTLQQAERGTAAG